MWLLITLYIMSIHWSCRKYYNSLNHKDYFDIIWYDGSMMSCSPPKVCKKSADHKIMPQSLHTTVLQAQYLHWPGEESWHTSAISCPTWLGPRLSWRALCEGCWGQAGTPSSQHPGSHATCKIHHQEAKDHALQQWVRHMVSPPTK